ncbi:GntR family transcriptional regulator [Pseudactinotalea sp. HY158]|uniref:GntR family transcriptional regulator n=1 Tax=Pseudactinotalea sp. HY158 TaxID=2654547 RepID=UPI00129C9461|nr:GntR family transcriptional regulator [Pseudactinotalea sp. HY158]QGH70063.1 FCD domain-containing protein [Pseudactinotalea sp. HY158]
MNRDGQTKREPRALRADIHSALFDRLTTNHWAPGDHLSIDGLARELKVSPTPVREAMVALERSGLIKYRAQRGYVVAPPLDPHQIGQLIDARLVVERAALTRAFTADWPQFVQALRGAQRAHSQAAERIRSSTVMDYGRMREYFDADIQFHRAFFTFSENEFLTTMHESLGAHAHRMRQTWAGGRENFDLDETLHEHEQILNRVEERNHDGALAALGDHLVNVRTRFSR